MLDIGFEEAVLLVRSWVFVGGEEVGFRVVIVVAPFRKVVCKFEAGDVC